MESSIHELLSALNSKKIWHEEPVYCFTSDIDWASEAVLDRYFEHIDAAFLKLTTFVTHDSKIIKDKFERNELSRGIHPNFLPASSHGNNFDEVIANCMTFAPEARSYRSHRYFEVSDTVHLLADKYGFLYGSNNCTNMQSGINPYLHESGMVQMPVFLEDGTHLYNGMDLDISKYSKLFESPGLKIISFHPMNMVFNTPEISFMRSLKDSLSREEYNDIDGRMIDRLSNKTQGIGDTMHTLIERLAADKHKIMSLEEIYQLAIS